jgi:hypothetical protein
LQVYAIVSHELLQQSESCPHAAPALAQPPPPEPLPLPLLPLAAHVLVVVSHQPLQQSEA